MPNVVFSVSVNIWVIFKQEYPVFALFVNGQTESRITQRSWNAATKFKCTQIFKMFSLVDACKTCTGRWYTFTDHSLCFFKLLLCTSRMAGFPTSVSQWLKLGKFRSLSFKYSFDFSSYKTLCLPWCSCNPHIYVHDMVKQETPSEAESRQLLITAAATGGSIWKCVTSSNHWVQAYKWWGNASFKQHSAWKSFSLCQKRWQSVKFFSARVRKGFSNVHLHKCLQGWKRAAASIRARISAAANRNRNS